MFKRMFVSFGFQNSFKVFFRLYQAKLTIRILVPEPNFNLGKKMNLNSATIL